MTQQDCECLTWARVDWGPGNGIPPSHHHPNCPQYKLETFAQLEHDGARCVVDLNELPGMIRDAECDYIVRPIKMTRDQFDGMKDFGGF